MANRLKTILEERGPIKKVGVIGMGYVGIPLAVLLANSQHIDFVLGFQRNSTSSGYKIDMINRGESPIRGKEPGLQELLKKVIELYKFRCTSDFSRISELDAVCITIDTPISNHNNHFSPDNKSLYEVLKNVGRYISEGVLVVIESTVTPGTTDGIAREILEQESGLSAGENFALAHAPERVTVGRLLRNLQEIDRIVGGVDRLSTLRAMELYAPILKKGKIIVMGAKAAEVTKTAENAFRDLQIAAVNKLALYCEAMEVNIFDVREGIDSLKEEGVTRAILYPGAGVGGHCLTKDTYHLEQGVIQSSKKLDYPADNESLFCLARAINDYMPKHMYHLTQAAFQRIGKIIRGRRVGLLGWAFLENSDDSRETPSALYREMLLEEGAEVKVHDPNIKECPEVSLISDLNEVVINTDALAIFTAHDEYKKLDLNRIKKLMNANHPILVDGRNIINPDEAIQKGFVFKGIGRGDKNEHPINHT